MTNKAFILFFISIFFITGISKRIEDNNNKLTILEILELCAHLIIFINTYRFTTFIVLVCMSLFIRLIFNITGYDYTIEYSKNEILWIGRVSTALTIYDLFIINYIKKVSILII